MPIENILFFSLVFILGIFWGSFANVVILRLHNEEKGIITGKSHCPKCKHHLSFWDLFPVFSWICLQGKCRYCKTPISWQYPLVEFSMGMLWVFLLIMNNIGFENFLITGEKTLEGIFWIFFGFFFLVLFVADLRWMEVFRYISIPTIVLVIAGVFYFEGIFPTPLDAFYGALIPTGFFGLQIVLSRYIFTSRGDWVGEGDIDLGIIMGLLLGWKVMLLALALSYLLGSIIGVFVLKTKGADTHIAFGPFLLISLLLTLFWGEEMLLWYLGLIGF